MALAAPLAFGQVSVTDSGTASFTYPIAVPPGIAGMAPTLSLGYGGGGNGPAGYGWGIQGISTITRCPQTRGIDGFARGVNFDQTDKLCLDGQRLIQTDSNGTPTQSQTQDSAGGSGLVREFRTEKDSFARIRAYGTAGGDPANGPAYFRVWTKSGQIYDYGANPNASDADSNALVPAQGKNIAMVWAASRISDTAGNYIDFKYIQRDTAWGSGPSGGSRPGREWNLVEIRYTGNQTQLPTNRVVFDYTDRPDTPGAPQSRAEAYQAGSKNVSIWRLNAVRTYVNWANTALGVTAQGTTYPNVPSAQSVGSVVAPPPGAVKVKTVLISYTTAPNTGRSLVSAIKDCAGDEIRCSPPTKFDYTPGGNQAYGANTVFASSTLSTQLRMMDATGGSYGVVLGDFNGDSKTDILRWSNAPSENQLWLSGGGGNFNMVPLGSGAGQFNLSGTQLFSADGCYSSVVADFNADGIADVLQVANSVNGSGGACAAATSQLFLGNGDGSFKAPIPLTGIDLSTIKEKTTSVLGVCPENSAAIPLRDGDRLAMASSRSSDVLMAITPGNQCYRTSKTVGKSFFLIDVDGDGVMDIITTINPAYSGATAANPAPTPDQQCAATTCTRLYRGSVSNGTWTFAEQTATNLAHHSVYSPPVSPGLYSALVRPNTVDVDGDGLMDLSVSTGLWRSSGDGNFTQVTSGGGTPPCNNPIDTNGDGRVDCLNPAVIAGSTPTLLITTGAPPAAPFYTANFNLTGSGYELYAQNGSFQQSIGTLIGDFVGDGRSGILRWEDTPANNVLYLSNGDGTFRASTSFNLTSQSLRSTDGTTTYVAGDFSGRGTMDILRMKNSPSAGSEGTTNQLYERLDKSPPDLLLRVTSPSGLQTTLTWVPLTAPTAPDPNHQLDSYQRYVSDRGTPRAATYPQVDLITPMYVVATSLSATGVGGATIATEYGYAGLKADVNRGLLGFRQISRQSPGPNGANLTRVDQRLQVHPYIGATFLSRTINGGLVAAMTTPSSLSMSQFTYCDKSAGASTETSATYTTPCSVSAKVQKPYLYQSVELGTDLSGTQLPTVTTINTFDTLGNPTGIAVTTSGTAIGQSQQFTKTTTNIYKDPDIGGDNWVLGRLARATQRNSVPNALPGIGTSAGSAPNASATQGNGAAPAGLSPAVLSVILQLLLDD